MDYSSVHERRPTNRTDPLAHTLVGASLSETRLKSLSPLATPALVVAANAPDIDVVSMAVGGDFSLGFRRGWTHGVLAMIILPLAVAVVILLADRAIAARRGRRPFRTRAAPVVALSYIGVLSHPFLDWLNTYGIRLLMPFDGRWFYGDALFIIDPWVWLLAGSTVVLANTRSLPGQAAWVVLGIVLTVLVLGFAAVPLEAKLLWVAGLSVIVGVRVWGGAQAQLSRLALACLIGTGLYIVAMVGGSRLASQQVGDWLTARGSPGTVVMAGPLAATPSVRDVIVVDSAHYHFLELDWLRADSIRIAAPAINRGPTGPIVEAALTAPHLQGVLSWIRFPAYTVEPRPSGYRVTVRDVRYTRLGAVGLGTAVVDLDRELRVRSRE